MDVTGRQARPTNDEASGSGAVPSGRDAASTVRRIEIVGAGRMGSALAVALRAADAAAESGAGFEILGPSGRGARCETADAVLLAVPDAAIADAAAAIAPGRLVGHVSGATPLATLAPHEAFGLHPLTTVTAGMGGHFVGVHAAVGGTSARALSFAEGLAETLGMRPFRLADEDRPAYHAAASVASNFLVALEGFAEQLAASAGVPRQALAPLVRATVRNWQALGARDALTGPVARGDEATVARQREAVAERAPERLPLFDALVTATRELAAEPAGAPAGGPADGGRSGIR